MIGWCDGSGISIVGRLVLTLVEWFWSQYWWDGFCLGIGGMVLVLVLVGSFWKP